MTVRSWDDAGTRRRTTRRAALALAAATLLGCSSGAGVSGTTTDGRGGAAAADDVGERPLTDTDDGGRPVRPDRDTGAPDSAAPDATPSDAGQADVGVDLGVVIDAATDDAFVRPTLDADPPDTDAPDTDPPDAVDDADTGAGRLSGDYECYHYDIYLANRSFDFKVDDIAMVYTVRNTCARPMTFRVRHEDDFFPIVIERDGEPWVYLPDCPAPDDTSPSLAREFEFRAGEGWSRGRFWNAAEHEAQLARCSVVFEPTSSYAVRGYGMVEVNLLEPDSYSVAVPITEAIPIELRP